MPDAQDHFKPFIKKMKYLMIIYSNTFEQNLK